MSFTAAHFLRTIPLVFSWIALLLAILVLCAGNKPGVLKGHNVITVDIFSPRNGPNNPVSNHVLETRAANDDCSGSGALSWLCDSMTSAASNGLPAPTSAPVPVPAPTAGTPANGVENSNSQLQGSTPNKGAVAGRFYSLYTQAICEGVISQDESRTMEECHPYFTGDPSTIPYLLSLSNTSPTTELPKDPSEPIITLTYPLISALEQLSTLTKTITVLWAAGLGFTGLSLFASIPAIPLGRDEEGHATAYEWAVYINLAFAICGFGFLMLGGMVGAAGAKVNEGTINGLGRAYADEGGETPGGGSGSAGFGGVTAVAGTQWVVLAWATVALMSVVLVYWVVRAVKLRRAKKEAEEYDDEGSVEEIPQMVPQSVPLEPMPLTAAPRGATVVIPGGATPGAPIVVPAVTHPHPPVAVPAGVHVNGQMPQAVFTTRTS